MVSFVIPAHNEEASLPATLQAIARAGPDCAEPFEVIVADDSSTDRTSEVAAAHGARVVRIEKRQISATRNAGAREARGDKLIFVDADTQVTPEAVRGALRVLRSGAAGGGSAVRFDGWVPVWSRIMLAVLLVLFRWLKYTGGAFLFCSRTAFDAAGGWDESVYAGEEILLARALKRQGRFVILREKVITSGRKLRAYSPWEIFGQSARIILRGTAGVKRREGLELWYARRNDPGEPTEPRAEVSGAVGPDPPRAS